MAASAAHTASLSSGWKLHDSSPELRHQERERKKTAFHSVAYYSEGDSLDDLVLSCTETLQSDRGAAVIIGSSVTKNEFSFAVALVPVAVSGNEKTEEFKVFFFCFIFESLFVTTGLNEATWCCASFDFYACSFLRFLRVTSYSSLWNFCLTEWALWATFCCKIIELRWKNKHCQAPNYKIITYFDQS